MPVIQPFGERPPLALFLPRLNLDVAKLHLHRLGVPLAVGFVMPSEIRRIDPHVEGIRAVPREDPVAAVVECGTCTWSTTNER